jgi:hypothetical protein
MLVLGGQAAAFKDMAEFKHSKGCEPELCSTVLVFPQILLPKLLVLAKYDIRAVLAMVECIRLKERRAVDCALL